MSSGTSFLFVNGVVSPPSETPTVSSLLESHSGAYTTSRTHKNGSEVLFWERHLQRLAHSAKIIFNSYPELLFKPVKSLVPILLQRKELWEWDLEIKSIVNSSMRIALPVVLDERSSGKELSITVLLSGNIEKLNVIENIDKEDFCRLFDVYLHVGLYSPPVFGGGGSVAHLAVVGRGRHAANAKYSEWVRIRKPLEKLRPPSATELLLSNDGNQILEGCITNFFVVCRKDTKEIIEYTDKDMHSERSTYPFEIQTAPLSDGVLPGVIRQVIIEVCQRNSIPLREVAPSWSKRDLWEEAFITNSLRLLQHVETVRAPSSWHSLQSMTLKDVTWEEKRFKEGPGAITTLIQKEIMAQADVEGQSVSSFIR